MIVAQQHRRPLTAIQERILGAIVRQIREHGTQPSLHELHELTGLSVQAVHYQIRALEIGGWLESSGRMARSLVLPPDVRDMYREEATHG